MKYNALLVLGGLTEGMPVVQLAVLSAAPKYGPDLPPAPAPPPGAFDKPDADSSSIGETIFGLSVAFPGGAEIRHDAVDGQRIYKDRDWVFSGLPDYLKGADYLLVANDDATTSAGEGVVFKIGNGKLRNMVYDRHCQRAKKITTNIKCWQPITNEQRPVTQRCSSVVSCGFSQTAELNVVGLYPMGIAQAGV